MAEPLTSLTGERGPLMWTHSNPPLAHTRNWTVLSYLVMGVFALFMFGSSIFGEFQTDISIFQKALRLIVFFGVVITAAVALWGTNRCIVSVHFNQDGLTVNAVKARFPGGVRHPVHYCVPWTQVKSASLKRLEDEYGNFIENAAVFEVIGSRGRPHVFSLFGFSREAAMVFVSRVQSALAQANKSLMP